jgi:hypothetical protein
LTDFTVGLPQLVCVLCNKQDNTLVMSLEDKPVLELPLTAVSQCVLPGTNTVKNEVEMQVRTQFVELSVSVCVCGWLVSSYT